MHFYVGTYDGNLIHLIGNPMKLSLKHIQPISKNSIRKLKIHKSQLFAGGFDEELRVLDFQTCSQAISVQQNNGLISSIIGINKKILAVGCRNGLLRIWNMQGWNLSKQIRLKKSINDMKIDPKGLILLIATENILTFWCTSTMSKLYRYKFNYKIEQILIDNDFKRIYLVTDKYIHEIQTENNKEVNILTVSHRIQCTILFNNFIIVASDHGNVQIWLIGHYQYKLTFKAHDTRIKIMRAINYQNTNYLITGSSDGEISVWDILQFMKEIDKMSQNYILNDLKPISSLKVNQRILCLQIYQPEIQTTGLSFQKSTKNKIIRKKNKKRLKNIQL